MLDFDNNNDKRKQRVMGMKKKGIHYKSNFRLRKSNSNFKMKNVKSTIRLMRKYVDLQENEVQCFKDKMMISDKIDRFGNIKPEFRHILKDEIPEECEG